MENTNYNYNNDSKLTEGQENHSSNSNQNQNNSLTEKPKNKKEETWFSVIRFTILVTIIIIIIRMFVIEPYLVKGESMIPNFKNNDYLLVEKISSWAKVPNYKRGDIVIFKSPAEQHRTLIKRIIGLPKETIQMKNGKIYINSNIKNGGVIKIKLLNEPYLTNISNDNLSPITLKKDEFFVEGDNRPASYDSRFWGPLPANNIIGRPVFRLYHWSDISIWPAKFNIKLINK